MKILHYVESANLSFRVPWVDLMRELRKKEVEQSLLCRVGGNMELAAKEADIDVVTWKPLITNFPPANLNYMSIIKKIAPDIIHTRLSSAANIGGFWGKILGIPTVAMLDGNTFKRKYYSNVDYFMACSESAKNSMVRQGIDPGMIEVVYNSIDIDKYKLSETERKNFRDLHDVGPQEKVFTGVGSFTHVKGFDILIKAFSRVAAEQDHVKLFLAGDGPEREHYRKLVYELGSGDRIIFSDGYQSDVRPWLWGADYFVLPSRNEPFGIIVLEAMASGLPVIATKSGGPTEIITNGFEGICVDIESPEAIADAMKKMLNMDDTGYLEEMRTNSIHRVADFSNEKLATREIEIFEKVIAKQKSVF